MNTKQLLRHLLGLVTAIILVVVLWKLVMLSFQSVDDDPIAPVPTATPATVASPPPVRLVKGDESLWSIARCYGGSDRAIDRRVGYIADDLNPGRFPTVESRRDLVLNEPLFVPPRPESVEVAKLMTLTELGDCFDDTVERIADVYNVGRFTTVESRDHLAYLEVIRLEAPRVEPPPAEVVQPPSAPPAAPPAPAEESWWAKWLLPLLIAGPLCLLAGILALLWRRRSGARALDHVDVAILFAGCVIDSLLFAASQQIGKQLALRVGLSEALAGYVPGLSLLGFGLGMFALNAVRTPTDRLLRRLKVLAAVVVAVGALVSPSVALLFVTSVLTGMFAIGQQVAIPMLASEWRGDVQRTTNAVLTLTAGIYVGLAFSSPYAALIGSVFADPILVSLPLAALALVGAAAFRRLPARPAPAMAGGAAWGIVAQAMRQVKLRTPISVTVVDGIGFFQLWVIVPLVVVPAFGIPFVWSAFIRILSLGGTAMMLSIRGFTLVERYGARLTRWVGWINLVGWTLMGVGFGLAGTSRPFAAVVFVLGLILVDGAYQCRQVLTQARVNDPADPRSPVLNRVYMGSRFVALAIGVIITPIIVSSSAGFQGVVALGLLTSFIAHRQAMKTERLYRTP